MIFVSDISSLALRSFFFLADRVHCTANCCCYCCRVGYEGQLDVDVRTPHPLSMSLRHASDTPPQGPELRYVLASEVRLGVGCWKKGLDCRGMR